MLKIHRGRRGVRLCQTKWAETAAHKLDDGPRIIPKPDLLYKGGSFFLNQALNKNTCDHQTIPEEHQEPCDA